MTRTRFSIAAALGLTLSIVGVAATVADSPTPEPLADQFLAQIHGADQNFNVNFSGDCDSLQAAKTADYPCDGCSGNQPVAAGKLCVCCDNGGLVDMQVPPPGRGGQYSSIKPTPTQYDCGKITYRGCVFENGQRSCSAKSTPTPNSCGSVQEYPVQSTSSS